MNPFRISANLVKRNMEPPRPSKNMLGDEGYDYFEGDQLYPQPAGIQAAMSMEPMGLMAAAAPVRIPTLEDIAKYHRKKVLWYPWAQKVSAIKHRGRFNGLYPAGGIFHFNAGRNNPVSTMDSGRKNGYLYSACGRFGEHVQSNPFDQWGYHAGKSAAKIGGKTKSGVSAFLHGVEVSSAGSVDLFKDGSGKPWFWRNASDTIPASMVRSAGPHAGQLRSKGHYHAYTKEQEQSMTMFWVWMKVNNPDVFRLEQVYGHDEVAVPFGRKTDPGGALSMYMDDYRQHITKVYDSMGLR